MNARYFVVSTARFASADTLVPDPMNPQSLNRYTYVLNAPLLYIDPSGHIPCEQMPMECQKNSNGDKDWGQGDFEFEDVGTTIGNVYMAQYPFFMNPDAAINETLSWVGEKVGQGINKIATSLGFEPPMETLNEGLEVCLASPNCLLDIAIPSPSNLGSPPSAYLVAYEMELPAGSFPGTSRGYHFQLANEQLAAEMQASSEFTSMMNDLGITQDQLISSTGTGLRTSPPGWTWHHEASTPGVLQLVPRNQHLPGSPWQPLFHPGGRGGFANWGK